MTPNESHFEELNARIEALEGQRNRALTDAVVVSGKLSVANAKLAEAHGKLAKFQATLAELNTKLAALVITQEA